jgi:hypothetical protein
VKNFSGILLFSLLIITGISSCKRDPSPAPDLGFNYFPDAVGTYVVYDVDSFSYNNSFSPVKIDTFKYQLKEKIESIYTDNQGRPTIRLERYIKRYSSLIPYSAMSWKLRNVWAENKTLKRAERVEDNVRYVRLLFPVYTEETWNGNAQNTLPEEEYSYSFYDLAGNVGGIEFDSVLQVIQHDEISLVHKTYAEEKYARNTGLIYRRFIDVDSQPPASWYQGNMPYLNDSLAAFYQKNILDRVSSGHQYTITVNSYGKE